MYNEHFGFTESPFSISPDPRFLFLSERHRDALAHLVYGAGENGGFVLLTGQVGAGKTLLIRSFLEQHIENIDVALCLYSGLSALDFFEAILDELRVGYPRDARSLKPLLDALNIHLLKTHAAGRETVIIIDEAQNLSREVLEQVRMLTNLETNNKKLLRIILVGQEELQEKLNREDLRQLAQRITTRYHLTALNSSEVELYIKHRLRIVKGKDNIFPRSTMHRIYQVTDGLPRLINTLCDKTLLCAYTDNAEKVTIKHVKDAENEIFFHDTKQKKASSKGKLILASLLVASLLLTVISLVAPHIITNNAMFKNVANLMKPNTANTTNAPSNTDLSPKNNSKNLSEIDAHKTNSEPKASTVNKDIKPVDSADGSTNKAASGKNGNIINTVNSNAAGNGTENIAANITKTTDVSNNAEPKAKEEIVVNHQDDAANSVQTPKGVVSRETSNIGTEFNTIKINSTTSNASESATANVSSAVNTSNSVPINDSGIPKKEENNKQSSKQNTDIIKTLFDYPKTQMEGVISLLRIWDKSVNLNLTSLPCDELKKQQVVCLDKKGSFIMLKAIDRPAILELQQELGKSSWIVLRAINDDGSVVIINDKQLLEVAYASIAQYWTGRFITLLNEPNVQIKMAPNFKGEQVKWLRQRIAIAEHQDYKKISSSLLYDDKLVDSVKNFQAKYQLGIDGIVGNDTLLYLYNVVAPAGTPLLYSEK